MTTLSSTRNPLLKQVRQAAETGRPLDDGCVIAEGPHLVAEALNGNWLLRHVLATPECITRFPALFARLASRGNIELTEVAPRAFQTIAPTEHSQGILALLEPRQWRWPDLTEPGGPLVILDPHSGPWQCRYHRPIRRSVWRFGCRLHPGLSPHRKFETASRCRRIPLPAALP